MSDKNMFNVDVLDKIYQEEIVTEFDKKIQKSEEKPKTKKTIKPKTKKVTKQKTKKLINEETINVVTSKEILKARKLLGSTSLRKEKIEFIENVVLSIQDRASGVSIGPLLASMVKILNPMFFERVASEVNSYLVNPNDLPEEDLIDDEEYGSEEDEYSSDEYGSEDDEYSSDEYGSEDDEVNFGADDVIGKGLDNDSVNDLVNDSVEDNKRGRLMKNLMARTLLKKF